MVLQPVDHRCGPPLDLLKQVDVFLVLGTSELDASRPQGCEVRRITSLDLLVMLLLM